MGKTVYVVIDDERNIYGVYEEAVDAEDRRNEVDPLGQVEEFKHTVFIEEYVMNKDFDPN